MFAKYNHEKTKTIYYDFINNHANVELSYLRKDIIHSWQRCNSAPIDPFKSKFSFPAEFADLDSFTKQEWDYDRFVVNNKLALEFYDFLISIHAAIYYTDLNLNIIRSYGDSDLLKRLAKLNWDIGTNLCEENIGTNAAALSFQTKKLEVVVGAEHYCKILHPYVTASCPFNSSYWVIIANHSKFSPFLSKYIELYTSYLSYRNQAEENKLALAISPLYTEDKLNPKAKILINEIGKIIDVSKRGLRFFNLPPNSFKNKYLKTLIPDLEPALRCLSSNDIHHLDLNVQNVPMHVYCQSVRNNESNIYGMVITLESKEPLNHKTRSTYHFSDLIGVSPRFMRIKKMAERASLNSSNVLIYGESGTGKELFAQAIHNSSERKHGPFISINCAVLPKELIASELFGYAEGAFTGARKGGAPGKFELAQGGTLFLDEIAEMPIDMQSALLRVLEERRITRLGYDKLIELDVRIISATNKNLSEAIANKTFRLDLYYRLNVIPLELIPLRERSEDIPLLIEYYVNLYNEQFQTNIAGFTPDALAMLKEYNWPGNVRELRNIVERGINLCFSDYITVEDLPTEVAEYTFNRENLSINHSNNTVFQEYKKKIAEMNQIKDSLAKCNGNKVKAAHLMGLSRSKFYRKLKEYNLVEK